MKRRIASAVDNWLGARGTAREITWADVTWGRPKVYTYPATILKVHDGDTVHADLDLVDLDLADIPWLGLRLRLGARLEAWEIRLGGCNARELSEAGGREARDNLSALLPVGAVVTASVLGLDKYRRRLDANITLPDGQDLVARLITDGWAVRWDGRGTRPVPPWPRPTP